MEDRPIESSPPSEPIQITTGLTPAAPISAPTPAPAPKPVPASFGVRLKTLLALVACSAAIFYAVRSVREGMRPSLSWVRTLYSGNLDDRQIAASVLGESNPKDLEVAVPSLIAALEDRDPPVRAASATALGVAALTALREKTPMPQGREAASALLKALNDAKPEVRGSAASALGEIAGSTKKETFPADLKQSATAVVALLADSSITVRKRAEMSLSHLAALDPIEPPAPLIDGLGRWELKESRAIAAIVLPAFKGGVEKSVSALTKALKDTEPEVRSNAAVALQRFGADAAPSLPNLVANVGDAFVPPPPPPARYPGIVGAAPPGGGGGGNVSGGGRGGDVPTNPAVEAINAIGRIVSEQAGKGGTASAEVVEALTKALKSERADVKAAAESALRKLGKGASAAIPELLKTLAAKSAKAESDEAPSTIEALAEIAPGSAEAAPVIAALTASLGSKDEGTRTAAAAALGKFGPAAADAVPRLRELEKDPAKDVVAAAKKAADQIEGKSPPDAPRRKGGGRRGGAAQP